MLPDDLRYLIRTIADPEHANDRPPVNRDDPTVTWCEEAKEHDYITLDSCVARTYWIYQWPDFDVQAGWIRDLVTDRRMMAFCHIWRPLTMEQSEAELRNRKSSMRQRSKLQDQREKSRDERQRRRSSGYVNWSRRPTGRTPTIRDTSPCLRPVCRNWTCSTVTCRTRPRTGI